MTARRLIALVLVLGASCATSGGVHPRPLPQGVSFQGTWDSTWGKMILEQEGGHVRGTFTGYREGSLSGELEGDVLHFIWDQRRPHSHGHGYLQMAPDGSHVEGRWGYLKDDSDGGRWAADRDTSGL